VTLGAKVAVFSGVVAGMFLWRMFRRAKPFRRF
jgi:hypothetical protein